MRNMVAKLVFQNLFWLFVLGWTGVGIVNADVVHLSREKAKSFTLKKELVYVYSTSFMTKLGQLIANTKSNVQTLKIDRVFSNEFKPVETNNSVWNKVC